MSHAQEIHALGASRRRYGMWLTAAMMVVYFGFILLVAFDKPLLATVIVPGLSLGILLGALVIVAAWGLMWAYVHWANGRYDSEIKRLKAGR